MAVQATPYVETALSHTAELFRRNLQASLPIGSAGGVIPATPTTSANLTAGVAACSDLQVTAPVSGMSVKVSAGQIYVPGSSGSGSTYGIGSGYGQPVVTLNGGSIMTVATSAAATVVQLTTQGTYYCYNDNSGGAIALTISASSPSNPRIDVVIAQVEDAAYSGSNNDWKLAVVTGTAAASPAVPALPASSIALAYVWVPTSATNIITADILDLRVAFNRNPFRWEMYRNGAYTQATATAVQFPYDTIVSDLTGSLTTGASASLTVPVSGQFQVSALQSFSATVLNRYLLMVYKNGTEVKRLADLTAPATVSAGPGGSSAAFAVKGDLLSIFFQSVTQTNIAMGVGSATAAGVEFTLIASA